MTQEILQAFLLIFVAEMGDKTQILAMAFATRFPVKKVLLGIGIGSFLNHGLAVLLGSYLSSLIPINTLQMVAGVAFVAFALWTLKSEENDDHEEEPKIQFGPIVTVAVAFFLGEFGDKTQLTAITLAADAYYPMMILVGTVTGMVVTGTLGIFVGKKMGDRIPELGIKLFSASIFMFFGLQKLTQTIPSKYLNPGYVVPVLIGLSIIVMFMIRKLLKQSREAKKVKPIEDRIINLGNRISNIYLIEILDGYVLVDTGYREQYDEFCKKLNKYHIGLNEITYVFLTHAHDDHAGFLNQILEVTKAKVVLHPEAVSRLKSGQNSFEGGCSSKLAWSFCQIMKLFGKGEHKYQPVNAHDRYLIVNEINKQQIETLLGAKIIELPGHTRDSIGLLYGNQVLFSGDATMNGLPSRYHIIIWIEDLIDYKNTWKEMTKLECGKIYPSHGSPFTKNQLIKNTSQLDKIKIHPLH